MIHLAKSCRALYSAFVREQHTLLEPFCQHFLKCFPTLPQGLPHVALLQFILHHILQKPNCKLILAHMCLQGKNITILQRIVYGVQKQSMSVMHQRFAILPLVANELGFGLLTPKHDCRIAHYLLSQVCFPHEPRNTSGILNKEPTSMKRPAIGKWIGMTSLYHEPIWQQNAVGWQVTCWILSNQQLKDFPLPEPNQWYYVQARIQFNHNCKLIDCKMVQCVPCKFSDSWKAA